MTLVIILIMLVLLLLGGVGAGCWFYLRPMYEELKACATHIEIHREALAALDQRLHVVEQHNRKHEGTLRTLRIAIDSVTLLHKKEARAMQVMRQKARTPRGGALPARPPVPRPVDLPDAHSLMAGPTTVPLLPPDAPSDAA